MRTTTTNDDSATDAATATRLLARVRAQRPAVVLSVVDGDERVPVALRDVHHALEAAFPRCSVKVGTNFWTRRERRISLAAWHGLVERTLQDQAARIRELEAAQSAPVAITVTMPPIERRTVVERDANQLITATRTRDVPLPP
jgi:hypothetical protein